MFVVGLCCFVLFALFCCLFYDDVCVCCGVLLCFDCIVAFFVVNMTRLGVVCLFVMLLMLLVCLLFICCCCVVYLLLFYRCVFV